MIMPNLTIEANQRQFSEEHVKVVKTQGDTFISNHMFFVVGDDFAFDRNAKENFEDMEIMFKLMNSIKNMNQTH